MDELHPSDFIPEVRCCRCERPEPEMGEWIATFMERDDREFQPICEHCLKENHE